jgi:hypothetical protein
VLLVVFLAAMLSTPLPPRLLDPTNNRLRARWNAFRRWALAACLGFLQLIPVQDAAAWRFHTTVTGPAPGAGIGDEPWGG